MRARTFYAEIIDISKGHLHFTTLPLPRPFLLVSLSLSVGDPAVHLRGFPFPLSRPGFLALQLERLAASSPATKTTSSTTKPARSYGFTLGKLRETPAFQGSYPRRPSHIRFPRRGSLLSFLPSQVVFFRLQFPPSPLRSRFPPFFVRFSLSRSPDVNCWEQSERNSRISISERRPTCLPRREGSDEMR